MEFKVYLRLLWQWLWLIILVMMLSGVATYFISMRITPVYTTSATIFVTRRSGAEFSLDLTTHLTGTYAQLLRRRPVLEEVIANLGLNADVKDLLEQITVSIDQSTMLITLTVTDSDPDRAAGIANEIIAVVSHRAIGLLGNDQDVKRSNLQVVEAPQIDPVPIAPKPLLNTLLVSLLAGLLVAGMVFFARYLDESLRSGEQAEALVGLPVLAVVGQLRRARLIDKLLPTSQVYPLSSSEAYQLLRAKIEYADAGYPIRTILVTSSKQLEGKSTILAQLAMGMAQVGRRVVIVDTNVREPSLHTLFQVKNVQGLVTALSQADGKPISAYLTPTGIKNVLLLTSGPQVVDPVPLLESQKLGTIIDELKACADIVLFDSPPVLAAVDAALLARQCDATLLVVRTGLTRTDELLKARSQLNWFNIQPFGLVINSAGSSLKGPGSDLGPKSLGRSMAAVEAQADAKQRVTPGSNGIEDSSVVL